MQIDLRMELRNKFIREYITKISFLKIFHKYEYLYIFLHPIEKLSFTFHEHAHNELLLIHFKGMVFSLFTPHYSIRHEILCKVTSVMV